MKRVYVSERGQFDVYGRFHGHGVIGVVSDKKLASGYPIRHGCYRHKVSIDSLGFSITYKSCCSDKGYRITAIDAY